VGGNSSKMCQVESQRMDSTWRRQSCKKFERMALMKVPTGTTVMPPEVKNQGKGNIGGN